MTEVVTVACKLPNGLILRTFRKETITQAVIGGGTRQTDQFVPTGQQHTINGNAPPFAKPLLDAAGNAINLEQSFALTHDIPKAFWELWLEQNKDTAIVKYSLIFASGKPIELRAMAKASRDEKHGLEPIDTHPESGDPRMGPKGRTKHQAGGFSAIARADVAATG